MMTTDGAPPTPGPSLLQVHDALRVTLDSLNKQLSGAHCWPSIGTDSGHTEMNQGLGPTRAQVSAGCLSKLRSTSDHLHHSSALPVPRPNPRDANSKAKRGVKSRYPFPLRVTMGETETQTGVVLIKHCAESNRECIRRSHRMVRGR